jgi:hypothetical protein
LATSIPRLRNSVVSPGPATLATKIAFLRYGLASASLDSASGYQGASWVRLSRRSISPDFMEQSTRIDPCHCPAKGRSASAVTIWSCNKGLGVIQSSGCVWCPDAKRWVADTHQLRLTVSARLTLNGRKGALSVTAVGRVQSFAPAVGDSIRARRCAPESDCLSRIRGQPCRCGLTQLSFQSPSIWRGPLSLSSYVDSAATAVTG